MSQQPRPDSAENCPQLLGQPGRSLVWTREKVTRTVKCWEKRHEIQVQHRNYRNSVQKEKSKETSLPVQWAWLKLGNQNKLLNEKGRNTNLSGIHFNSHHLLLRHRFCLRGGFARLSLVSDFILSDLKKKLAWGLEYIWVGLQAWLGVKT